MSLSATAPHAPEVLQQRDLVCITVQRERERASERERERESKSESERELERGSESEREMWGGIGIMPVDNVEDTERQICGTSLIY